MGGATWLNVMRVILKAAVMQAELARNPMDGIRNFDTSEPVYTEEEPCCGGGACGQNGLCCYPDQVSCAADSDGCGGFCNPNTSVGSECAES
jgi:hypothetical protein